MVNPLLLDNFVNLISDQPHTSFWHVVRTCTRTELWRCVDYHTSLTPTLHLLLQKQKILKNNFYKNLFLQFLY